MRDRRVRLDHRGRARRAAPTQIHLRAPPSLSDDLAPLLVAGIDDRGGVSPVALDHVNPERPWPASSSSCGPPPRPHGKVLTARLTIYPECARDDAAWVHPDLRFTVMQRSDGEGFARRHVGVGRRGPPPQLLPFARPARAGGPVGGCSTACFRGEEVGVDEIVTLLGAPG